VYRKAFILFAQSGLLDFFFFFFFLQEPLMEVISPGSKALQTYMTNRLLVYMAREFRASEKRHLLPCIRADELPGQFPYLSEAIIRKKLKEHANLQVIIHFKDFLFKSLIGCGTSIFLLLWY
jgi:hypothetical protein